MQLNSHAGQRRFQGPILGLAIVLAVASSAFSDDATQTLRGRVEMLAAGAADNTPRTALRTADGRLHPIVNDVRGCAFHLDPRLLDYDWMLNVRRAADEDAVRIVRSCVWRDEQKWEFDYWCDICAIPMTHLKECECCQGPIRLRLRLVDAQTDRATDVEP